MILTQTLKKEQIQQRLELKNAEEALKRQIVCGTNCSPFESEIVVEKAKQAFGVGQYEEGRILLDGQMVFHAIAADVPPGVPLERAKQQRIVLTPISRHDDLEVLEKHGSAARRQQQILRMSVEAKEQNALLTQEDLSLLVGCNVRTIRSDIQALRKQGLTVPTRGTVRDIGPAVTHKRRAVELWLEGKEALQVARHLNHSLRAVERYIQTFCRVVHAQRELRNALKTALVVGISVPAFHTYWDLHCELVHKDPAYQERLEEILQIGQAHWDAADGKKNRGPSARSKRKEDRP